MFDMPIDVTAKRVGNIDGCAIQTPVKAAVIPNLAIPTKMGMVQVGLAASTKIMIARPAKVCRTKSPMKTLRLLKYAKSTNTKMGAMRSTELSASVFAKKLPGMYLTWKESM